MSSEEEIIRCWLKGLFKTIENTDYVEVKDFNFGPLDKIDKNGSSYKSSAVLRQVSVSINVKNAEKNYSLVVKVLPTDDNERYSIKYKFKQLLKFSKEVQVYLDIVNPMFSLCNEKLSQLKFSSPPVAKVFMGQMDALNDCLVLENLSVTGFVKYKQGIHETENNNGEKREEKCQNEKDLSELIIHCKIVLQNMAKFHALSLAISRLEGKALSEIFPFAVEGEGFRQVFKQKMVPLKERLLDYLKWDQSCLKEGFERKLLETIINKEIHELFWKLLEMKARTNKMEAEVLMHGDLDFSNIMFRYENKKPIDCKFLDLSHVSVSSPIMDIITFLYSVMRSSLIETYHLSFLLHYHSHLVEFCHQLDVTEDITSLEDLVKEFDEKKMFGMTMNCMLMMAESLLKQVINKENNADAASAIYISPAKATLYLQNIGDLCLCPTHRDKIQKERELPTIRKSESILQAKKNEGVFVTFIKSSSLSPRLRNIL